MLRSVACDCFRQPVFSEGCFLLYLPHEAAWQLSQDDLVLLLRQQPGGALTEDIDRPQAQLFHLRLCQVVLLFLRPLWFRLHWLLLLLLAPLLPQLCVLFLCCFEWLPTLQRCRSFLFDLMTVRAVMVRAAMEKKKMCGVANLSIGARDSSKRSRRK